MHTIAILLAVSLATIVTVPLWGEPYAKPAASAAAESDDCPDKR
jgi:hypothetical protein